MNGMPDDYNTLLSASFAYGATSKPSFVNDAAFDFHLVPTDDASNERARLRRNLPES